MNFALYTLLSFIAFGFTPSNALNLECKPNDDIEVENPDTLTYRSATSHNLDTGLPCITYGNNASDGTYPTFTVTNCSKNQEIMFTFSSRDPSNTGDGMIGGAVENYVIECLELTEDGIEFIAELRLTVGNPDPTIDPGVIATLSPVDVTFSIQTSIWTSDYLSLVSTANIGTELKWLITGPDEFDLLPLSCVAYGGTSVGGSAQKVLIINGCTQDETLLSHFVPKALPTSNDRSELFSDLYAFKFVEHDYITLACTLRVCDGGSASCSQSCSSKRRKRRSVDAFSTNDIERLKALLRERKQSYIPSKAELRGNDDSRHKGYIVKYLHVTEFTSSAFSIVGSPITVSILVVFLSMKW